MTLTMLEPTKRCWSHFPIFTYLSQDLPFHRGKRFFLMDRSICEKREQRCSLDRQRNRDIFF